MLIWIPPFIYLWNRQSTGIFRYSEDSFEIKNTVFLGANFHASWEEIDHIGIGANIENIILGFGKGRFTSFQGKDRKFKRLAVEISKIIDKKTDLKRLNEGVWELAQLKDNEIEEIIERSKSSIKYDLVLPLIYVILVLAGMFGLVMLAIELLKDVPIYNENARILAPLIVFIAMSISGKFIEAFWKIMFKDKKKEDPALKKRVN